MDSGTQSTKFLASKYFRFRSAIHKFQGNKVDCSGLFFSKRNMWYEIEQTDHIGPQEDDEDNSGLPVARERPELEIVLERAMILCSGPILQLSDTLKISSSSVSSAIRTLEEVERNQIHKIISETRWRIEGENGAAAILSLHPNTLRASMQKLKILCPRPRSSD